MLQLKWQLTLADLLQELSQLIPEVSVFLPALPARASLLYTIYYIRFSVKFLVIRGIAVSGQRLSEAGFAGFIGFIGLGSCLNRDLCAYRLLQKETPGINRT